MKETIYYVSDFKYFSRLTSEKYNSKKQMVGAHIKYVKDKAEEMIGNYKRIINNVDLIDKRVNSRVAMSFVMAIPNALGRKEIKEWLKEVRKLISEILKIKEEDIFIAYHNGKNSISGRENKHFHIVLTPRTIEDKPLRLKRENLKEFHRKLQEYIEKKGFKIRRDKEDKRIGHIGTRLRYDEELRNIYIDALKSKDKLREIEEHLANELRRKEEEKRKLKEEVYKILKDMEREKAAIGKEDKEEKGYKIYEKRGEGMTALLLTDKFTEKDEELLDRYEIIEFKDINKLPEILNSLDRDYVFYQLRLSCEYKFSEIDKNDFVKQLYKQLKIKERKKGEKRIKRKLY